MSILNDHMRPDLRPELHNNAKMLTTNIHHDMDLTNTKLHHTSLHHDLELPSTKLLHTNLHHDMELPNTKLHATSLHHSMELPMTSAHDPTASCSPLSSTDSKNSFIFTQEQVECVCEVSVKAIQCFFSKRRRRNSEEKNYNTNIKYVWFLHGISFVFFPLSSCRPSM